MVSTRPTYIVSTVELSAREVQFSGHASSIWYSHDPFVAFQKPVFGRTFVGNEVMSGVNDHVPMELIMNVCESRFNKRAVWINFADTKFVVPSACWFPTGWLWAFVLSDCEPLAQKSGELWRTEGGEDLVFGAGWDASLQGCCIIVTLHS